MSRTVGRKRLFAVLTLTAAALAVTAGIAWSGAPLHSASTASASASRDQTAYATLNSLTAGMYIGRFESALGIPVFVKASAGGGRTEKTFDGPGYLVQTIQDSTGTVELMAVTACRPDFNPTFATAIGDVTLGRSTLGNQKLAGEKTQPPFDPLYFLSPATANSYFYDQYYLGNPGNYVNDIVGLNDACKTTADFKPLIALGYPALSKLTRANVATTPGIQQFRDSAVINTFAETAPQYTNVAAIIKGFQIGADRLRVRALPGSLNPSREAGVSPG